MQTGMYGLGFLVVIAGIVYIGHLMHIPQTWMIGIVILLVGIGIMTVVQNSKSGGGTQ